MMRSVRSLLLTTVLALVVSATAFAQAPTSVQQTTLTGITLTAISATAAVNTATTLTIPAPAGGLYNYVCYLAAQFNNDTTGTVVTNAVSTSTNFNAFATKVSQPATASADSGVNVFLSMAAPGCVKSASPATATTFVSSAGLTHEAWTWYAVYFQAP